MTLSLLIQSITVYTLWGWGMYKFAQKDNYNTTYAQDNYVSTKAIILCVSLFAILSAIRWGVGVDYYSYWHGFETTKYFHKLTLDREIEYGWGKIMEFMAVQEFHYTVYFGFWAMVQILFVCLAMRSYPDAFPYAALLCVLGTCFLTMMNGIRQCVVCCSLIWVAHFISQKRIIPFIIWIFLASTIHKSVFITAPLFLLAYDNSDWKNIKLLITILFVCIVLGRLSPVNHFLENFSSVLENLSYDNYSEEIEEIVEEQARSVSWGPTILSNLFLGIIIICFYPKVLAYYEEKYVKISFKIYYIGFCANFLFMNAGQIFQRPLLYFIFFSIPTTAFTLAYLHQYSGIEKRWHFILLFLAIIPMYWTNIKAYRNPAYTDATYQFFFSPNRTFLRDKVPNYLILPY